eukprot:jgi/Ulvmu1/5852/UM025_0112.1
MPHTPIGTQAPWAPPPPPPGPPQPRRRHLSRRDPAAAATSPVVILTPPAASPSKGLPPHARGGAEPPRSTPWAQRSSGDGRPPSTDMVGPPEGHPC